MPESLSDQLERVLFTISQRNTRERPTVAIVMQKHELEHWKQLANDLEEKVEQQTEELRWLKNEDDGDPHVNALIDHLARDQVESELHTAGVIEDPDVDGGLLG